MKYAAAILALAAAVVAQSGPGGAVVEAVSPKQDAPEGCSPSFDGTFTFNTQNVTQGTPTKQKRATSCGDGDSSSSSTPLVITLKNGKLLDNKGRTGYIASNDQFQFDGPPQAGAIYTAGFSTCGNGTLALGGSAIFYNCLSGDFNNIYDKIPKEFLASGAKNCYQVYLVTQGCESSKPIVTEPSNSSPSGSSGGENVMSGMQSGLTMSTTTTSAPAASTPLAGSNSTAPVATGTGVPTSPTSPKPSPFTGGASMVAAGQKLLALGAGLAVFALF